MGLDMYAKFCKSENWDSKKAAPIESKECQEFFYWRKHHDLHGWMRRLWLDRNHENNSKEFNLESVRLYPEDLEQLKNDVIKKRLPKTAGFFFGDNPPDNDSKVRDLDFIKQALKLIKEGFVVYYYSWW